MKRALFLAGLCLALATPCQAAPIMRVFVLVGQSNMTGAAPLPAEQPPAPLVSVWRGKWTAGMEPSNFIARKAKYSPGVAFARALGWKVGIINCAVPGSHISSWQRGQANYRRCLQAVYAAGLPVAGVLMSQGEADTYTLAAADAWSGLALKFLHDFRVDIGNGWIPVVFAQLGYAPDDGRHPYWQYLHDLQPSIAGGNRRMIITDDLSKLADRVHFDTAAQEEIGRRFAEKISSKE